MSRRKIFDKAMTAQLAVKLPGEKALQFAAIAVQAGIPPSALLRRIVFDFLDTRSEHGAQLGK